MKIPTPIELGLPEKFHDGWRPNQEAAFDLLMRHHQGKRTKSLCMPTGSGKSGLNVGYAVWTQEPTCIVTQNNGLLKQYMDDFESMGMVSILGRANYDCELREDYSCEDGYAARCPYKGTVQCPATAADMRAGASRLVVTNYAKWTAQKRYGIGMGHFTQVIFDEGHYMPDALASAMQVTLHTREIEETLGLSFPPQHEADDMRVWKSWAREAKATVEEELVEVQHKIEIDAKPTWIRHFHHMRQLLKRMSTLVTANADTWIVDELERGYQFDPISPAKYGEAALLLRVPSILVTSATLRPKTLHMSGIGRGKNWKPLPMGEDTENYIFYEYLSDFDVADGPIYYMPVQRVDFRQDDLSMLWVSFDQFMAKRQDRKGLIDTVSYARRDMIINESRFARNFIINERGEPTGSTVEEFKASQPPKVLVSPVFGTGYDFPMDECEFIILAKVPIEPPSKIVKAREAIDKSYRSYRGVTKMEQTYGRGNRSKGDRCEGIIFDQHMQRFFKEIGKFASKSFQRRIKTVHTMPLPLKKL